MASEKLLQGDNLGRSTQGDQPSALWQPCGVGWQEGSRGRGYMYTYIWFMLLYGGNQHNIVKQFLQLKINFFKNVNFTVCITSIWLFPTCILYKKLVTKLFSWVLWVVLTNDQTWEGVLGNLFKQKGREPRKPHLQLVYEEGGWSCGTEPHQPWGLHLLWVVSVTRELRTSLVAQCIKSHLLTHATGVQSLVQEDLRCLRATNPRQLSS